MHDWEKRLYEAIPSTVQRADDEEEFDFSPLIALASEAGRQATYWQAKSQEQDKQITDQKERIERMNGTLLHLLDRQRPSTLEVGEIRRFPQESRETEHILLEKERLLEEVRSRLSDAFVRMATQDEQIQTLHELADRLLDAIPKVLQAHQDMVKPLHHDPETPETPNMDKKPVRIQEQPAS